MKRPQNYHEGRCSASISSIIKQEEEEEALVISNRKESHEQQSGDVMMMKDKNHFGGFKRLKVKGLIKP